MDSQILNNDIFPKFQATFTNFQNVIVTLPVHTLNITSQAVFDVADSNSMSDMYHNWTKESDSDP